MADEAIKEVLEFLSSSAKGPDGSKAPIELLRRWKKCGKFGNEWVNVCCEGMKMNASEVCRMVIFCFLEVYNHNELNFMIGNVHVIEKLAVEMSRIPGKVAGAIAIEINQLVMTLFQREGRRYSPVHGETSLLLFQTLFTAAIYSSDQVSKDVCCRSLHEITKLIVLRVEQPEFETEAARLSYFCSREAVWNVMKARVAGFTSEVPTWIVTENVFDNDVVMLARSLYCSIISRQARTQNKMAVECDRISFALLATLLRIKHVAMKAVLQFLFVVKTELTALMIRDPVNMDSGMIPEFMDFNFRLIENYREILKHETFLFMRNVFLKILDAPEVPVSTVQMTIEKFQAVPADVIVECFINLDGYVESVNTMKDVILKLISRPSEHTIHCLSMILSNLRKRWADDVKETKEACGNDTFSSWTKCKKQDISVAFKHFVENGLPYTFADVDRAITEFSVNYAADNLKTVFWVYEKVWTMLIHLCEHNDDTMASIIERSDEKFCFPYLSELPGTFSHNTKVERRTLRLVLEHFRTSERIIKEMDHNLVEFFLATQKSLPKEFWISNVELPTVRSFCNHVLPPIAAFGAASLESLRGHEVFRQMLLDLLALDFVFYIEGCSEAVFPCLDKGDFAEAVKIVSSHPHHWSSTWLALLKCYQRFGGECRSAIVDMTCEMPSITLMDFVSVLCNLVVDEATTIHTDFHELLMQILEKNAKREFIVWMNIWYRLSNSIVEITIKEENGSGVATLFRVISLRLRHSNNLIQEDQQSLFIPVETLLKKGKSTELKFKLLNYTHIMIQTQSKYLHSGWKGVFRVLETAATIPGCNRRSLLLLIEIYENYIHELIETRALKSSFDAIFSFIFFRTRYSYPASLVVIGAAVKLVEMNCDLESFKIAVDCMRRTVASQDPDKRMVPELHRLKLSGEYLRIVASNMLVVLAKEMKESPTLIDILDVFMPILVRQAPNEALDIILAVFPTVSLPLISFCSRYITMMENVKEMSEIVTKIITQGLTAFELDVDDDKVNIFAIMCINMAAHISTSLLKSCVKVLKPYSIQMPTGAKAYIICLLSMAKSSGVKTEEIAMVCNRLMILGEPFAVGVLEAVLSASDDVFKAVALLVAKQASDYIQRSDPELRGVLKDFFSRMSDLLQVENPCPGEIV